MPTTCAFYIYPTLTARFARYKFKLGRVLCPVASNESYANVCHYDSIFTIGATSGGSFTMAGTGYRARTRHRGGLRARKGPESAQREASTQQGREDSGRSEEDEVDEVRHGRTRGRSKQKGETLSETRKDESPGQARTRSSDQRLRLQLRDRGMTNAPGEKRTPGRPEEHAADASDHISLTKRPYPVRPAVTH